MRFPLLVRVIGWLWFLGAVLAGNSRLLQHVPPPVVQFVLFGLTALLLAAYFRLPSVRAWADGLDLRALVAVHLTRFVGFYFLVLYERDELPFAFAVPGGWGDNFVAALALVLIIAPLSRTLRHRAFFIWNVIGLTDILLVVITAARLGLADPAAMRALTYLPLSLLPTFLVPIIIATHVVIFVRLDRAAGPAPDSGSSIAE